MSNGLVGNLPRNNSLLIRHGAFLLSLIVISSVIRIWQITHTEVAARDSIGFIRYAWNLEQGSDWKKIFRESHQHPGYPFLIHLVSYPVRQFVADDLPRVYQLSAQVAASLFSVLLVIPLYFLGKEFFSRWQAFWIVALIQFLPDISKVLGDGLSESMFLTLATTALLFAIQGQGKPGFSLWFFSGLFSGAAYLVRPEGLAVVAASSLFLFGRAIWWRDKDIRSQSLHALASTLVGVAIIASPFMLVIGKITSKPTGNKILNQETAMVHESAPTPFGLEDKPDGNETKMRLASWWGGGDGTSIERTAWAAYVLGDSYVKGLNYLGLFLALIGLAFSGPLFRRDPRLILLFLVFLIINIALFRVAKIMGYLSERHALFGILIALLFVPFGASCLGNWGRILLRKKGKDIPRIETIFQGILLLALAVPSIGKSLEILHYNREGFRQAGQWLAGHIQPGDPVEDPFCWSHFYAGKVFLEGKENLPQSVPKVKYVVVERSKNPHVRLQTQREEDLIKASGRLVFSWKAQKTKSPVSVLVYSIPVPGG